MGVYAIIQARMGSTRLPGKVLMPIGEKPAIKHVVDRVNRSSLIDDTVVATSTLKQDDVLYNYCIDNQIKCFRGSENDVLGRYFNSALSLGATSGDYIVRVTGDCPFIDPDICDQVIRLAVSTDADYAANTLNETFPDGLDCEVIAFDVLKSVNRLASSPIDREHVTQYIIKHPNMFKIVGLDSKVNYGAERWTLDMKEDYDFLCSLYDKIGNSSFGYEDALFHLDKNPELRNINQFIVRNSGLKNDNKKDAKVNE